MLFISVPIAVIILTFFLLKYHNTNQSEKYKFGSDITTVFIGDSHIQKAINDKLLNSVVNLSQQSESLYFSFYKLENILQNNPLISKIYLGFSYHNLSDYYDAFIFGDFSKDISPRYFFILPLNEQFKLLKYNFPDLLIYLRRIYKHGVKNIFVDEAELSYLGYYENEFQNASVAKIFMDERIAFQFYLNEQVRPFSKINIDYLDKIIDLCQNNKINLIVLNTPLHPYYKSKIPIQYVEKYNEIIQKRHLTLMDLSEISLSDSCFVPDGDHVSEKGTLKLLTYLKNDIIK